RPITVQPDPTPSVRNKRLGRSTSEKEEQESSTRDSEDEEQEEENGRSSADTSKTDATDPEDEKSSSDTDRETSSKKSNPMKLVAFEVLPNDYKTKFRYGEREGFYVVTAQSRAIPYRLDIKAPAGPFIGLCLEAHGAEYESATLSGVELSSSKVIWSSALDSVGQGSAAALVEDQKEWPMTYNGKDPIWAVFAAEKPFGKPGPHSLKIELDHSDNSQRLPRFRLWGITGSGTVEEMAQAMRERKLAEKPFAEFIAHGLPEGGTGEVSLGKVFVGAEQFSAQLFGGSSDGNARFRLNEIPSDDAAAEKRWKFLLVADDQSTPVAELVLQGEKQADLTLRWLPIAAELPRAAGLQNGLLQLQIGPYSRSVPLREVREQVALSYSPKKTVRPRIEVPAGMPAAELRLALQFPATTFGTVSNVVLPVGGEEAETEVTIKDDLLLKLATSWKSSEITLTVKTFLPVKDDGKKKSANQKTKMMLFSKAMKEIPKFKKGYEDSKPVIAFIEKMEKFAGRTYLRKPEDKRDWMRISKQWYGLGLPPPKRIDPEVAKQLLGNAQAAQAAIKKDLDTLEGLQEWSKTFGQDGIAAIEFRVYTLIDGVPLELVRSTGWQD
ncbi:MAG: hypothetical protein VXZ84_12440, partial [Planctomycetota bacterium]|nr:hypothetical protein [Planctomycetota bacterium]